MSISATKERLEEGLLAFVWKEWSQLGIFASPEGHSQWAQDIEALLLFTFEVARTDPRLFDEVLDWLVTNEHLVSVRRLRTLAKGSEDPSLAAAALEWLAQHRPQARFSTSDDRPPPDTEQRLFFGEEGFPLRHPDGAFAKHGWLRSAATRSQKSLPVDMRQPIAFGLRLRRLLGTGARAEVVRFLLCTDTPRATAAIITQSAVYTKRNIQEALYELGDARVVTVASSGHEARYGIDRTRWATLLNHAGPFPSHVDWVQLLRALTKILRWLRTDATSHASEYLQASAARTLIEDVRQDLEWAGIAPGLSRTSADAVQELDRLVAQSLQVLDGK
ncbi:hypothetical protein [Baekduia sp.]|jgi:hypothetical protein|uniref:hypothetical protein n=1 Tax=Baekduia sp. TaxID=2600305 RepID=UPI002DF92E7F|nr:hypothetical protein [Baekduia sp.]